MRKPSKFVARPDISIFGAFWHRLVIDLAFLAMLAPSVGQLLDHRFAERQFKKPATESYEGAAY